MPGRKKNRAKVVVIASLTASVLLGAGLFCYFKFRKVPIAVEIEKATRRDITEVVVANGKIQPVVQVVINPEVSGEIIELPIKEGQEVRKGQILLKIKPDNYIAGRNLAEANYRSALAGNSLAQANFRKAELEFKRIEQLFRDKLVSESQYLEAKTAYDVMRASLETSSHQADQAKAALARAEDDLAKTTIQSPMDGTVTQLKSQLGERVVGTAMMAGTDIMTIANLDDMEARVDISEMDVVLIALEQKASLEVDAFRDRKFRGVVYEIANAAKTTGPGSQQEATKFQVKIRVLDKEPFRPGMSVTAEIETRRRTNVVAVPLQSVTTRLPKGAEDVSPREEKNQRAEEQSLNALRAGKRDKIKPIEVVFLHEAGKVKMVPVTRGISDDTHVEIVEGLQPGAEVISGSYKAINRELEDGKTVVIEDEETRRKRRKKATGTDSGSDG